MTSLNERLLSLIKTAMLTKNQKEVRTLRLIKSEFSKYETASSENELTPSVEISILKKMLKEREDSKSQYLTAGREDLANEEQEEIDVIQRFLPVAASKQEIENYIDSIIDSTDKKIMGKYIKLAKEMYPTADGKMIADIVKSKLL